MLHLLRLLALLLAAGALSACGGLITTSQSRLYALDTVQPAATVRCPIGFSIREIRIAGHLDRDEMVVDRDGARIRASADDVWAAPLKTELPRVLTRLLLTRLEGSIAVPYPWRFNELPGIALNVDIDRLEPVGGQLQALMSWSLVEPTANPVRIVGRGSFDTTVPLSQPGPGGTVAAINVALGRFADQLAARAGEDSAAGGVCRRASMAADTRR